MTVAITRNSTLNIKAIAIIMVMVGHLVGAKKISIPIEFLDIATFGVSLFLFLSGYGLVKSYNTSGLKAFFRKKVGSIYVPFVLSTILVSIYKGFFNDRFLEVIKTVIFMNPSLPIDGTMWYVYYIFALYVAFFVAFGLIKNNLLKVFSLFVMSLILFNFDFGVEYKKIAYLYQLHSFTFVLGVAFSVFEPLSKKGVLLVGVICFVLFLYFFSFYFDKYNYDNHVVTTIMVAPAIIFIVSYFDFYLKSLKFIGMMSYELYLFEGALRWNSFSSNEFSSVVIFFLLTFSIAFTFKSFVVNVMRKPLISKYLSC